VLSHVSSTATGGWRYRSAPSTPYTVTVVFPAGMRPQIAMYESGTTKGIVLYWDEANRRFAADRNSNLGVTYASSAFVGDSDYNYGQGPIAMRVGDDGADVTFEFSVDGVNYYAAHSEARGSFFTAAPDSIAVQAPASNIKAAPISIVSYVEA
jgi:hypothetical protein